MEILGEAPPNVCRSPLLEIFRVLHVDVAGDAPQSAANFAVAVFLLAPCFQCLHTYRTWVQSFEK